MPTRMSTLFSPRFNPSKADACVNTAGKPPDRRAEPGADVSTWHVIGIPEAEKDK